MDETAAVTVTTGMALAAFGFGALSASSLLIGALIGVLVLPPRRLVAAVMAFGAGALISALTFELIEEAYSKAGFVPLSIGFITGGLAFVLINRIINQQGGFLRKMATTRRFLRERKRRTTADLLERLSRVDILRALPAEDVQAIVPAVDVRRFPAGAAIFDQGDEGDALYLIESGEVDVLVGRGSEDGSSPSGEQSEDQAAVPGSEGEAATTTEAAQARLARLGPGAAFGEMALLSGEPRSATVVAVSDVSTWRIEKQDFDHLLAASPRLAVAVGALLTERVAATTAADAEIEGEARRWQEAALRSVDPESLVPTPVEIRHAAQEHGGGAPLAIFLGVLLDGIPESPVIGASMLHGASVSFTLIVALFLSNLPEAMSSAVGMRRNGYSSRRILFMWGFLVVFTGVGSMLGYLLFGNVPLAVLAGLEAAAAGAILAMLAETMMPEAYEQSGGAAIGMATLIGFLAAFFVKTLSVAHA